MKMVMWKTKSCPKCGGDLYIDSEDHIVFDHCLQCSFMKAYAEVKCPVCGSVMIVDTEAGEKELCCEKCGQPRELNPAAPAK
jgi:DNA-directed RNA polymerase subunit M/transcription elongation factor TFIIS